MSDKKSNTSKRYTDEFKNKAIDSLLTTFQIKCSLSKKGCPYDNAVAEATLKVI